MPDHKAQSVQRNPRVIQGGMGIGVSGWRLAKAVAAEGQLGVVSGTALDLLMVRRLQSGDLEGHTRRALAHFPFPQIVSPILERYYVEGGLAPDQPYVDKPMVGQRPSKAATDLLVVASFVEVFLAKEGHDGSVGINFLQKIQTPTLPSIYGAMLAEVDVVIVGAGIPRAIPGVLDSFARGQAARLPLEVSGASREFEMAFDPAQFANGTPPTLPRPRFFPIVSSTLLARTLVKKASGSVDGLIVEAHSAGGHNAPPRGKMALDHNGEPTYGDRDQIDLDAIAELGVPFWLAGSRGDPTQLRQALELRASGIQVGTLFAFCAESDLREDLKSRVHAGARAGELRVFTDPVASPTGYPFKVLRLSGTSSEADVYEQRDRVCDLGYLREAYEREDGSLGWRCPGEPEELWQGKGGAAEAAEGRKCLCNALTANVGFAQRRPAVGLEPDLVTSGDGVRDIARFEPGYGAAEVIGYLLGGQSS